MDWYDLLPEHIAARQTSVERARRALRAYRAGASINEIARGMHVSRTIVYKCIRKAQVWEIYVSPIENWMACGGEMAALAAKIKSYYGRETFENQRLRQEIEQLRSKLQQLAAQLEE